MEPGDGVAELAELVASLIAAVGSLNGHVALTAADPEKYDEARKRGQAIERELQALQARLSERWPEATR